MIFFLLSNINTVVFLPSRTMPISTFDPFSLTKAAEYSRTGTQIQEAVYYAESRFRAILTDINNDLNKSEIDRIYWIQKLLRRELVSIQVI